MADQSHHRAAQANCAPIAATQRIYVLRALVATTLLYAIETLTIASHHRAGPHCQSTPDFTLRPLPRSSDSPRHRPVDLRHAQSTTRAAGAPSRPQRPGPSPHGHLIVGGPPHISLPTQPTAGMHARAPHVRALCSTSPAPLAPPTTDHMPFNDVTMNAQTRVSTQPHTTQDSLESPAHAPRTPPRLRHHRTNLLTTRSLTTTMMATAAFIKTISPPGRQSPAPPQAWPPTAQLGKQIGGSTRHRMVDLPICPLAQTGRRNGGPPLACRVLRSLCTFRAACLSSSRRLSAPPRAQRAESPTPRPPDPSSVAGAFAEKARRCDAHLLQRQCGRRHRCDVDDTTTNAGALKDAATDDVSGNGPWMKPLGHAMRDQGAAPLRSTASLLDPPRPAEPELRVRYLDRSASSGATPS